MANLKELLINVSLALIFIFCLNVNSSPVGNTVVEIVDGGHGNETHEVVKVIECHANDDCGSHGHCTDELVCACDQGWATYINSANQTSFCDYQQRSKRAAFFISLFAGYTGADWFYLSRGKLSYILVGVAKLSLLLGCCSAWPLALLGSCFKDSDSLKSKLRILSTFFTLVSFAWWLVDWARILGNRFPDGNGIGLTQW